MIKKQKKMIVTLCLVASLFTSIIPLQASMTLLYKDALGSQEVVVEEQNNEIEIVPGQETIKIENKDFELFLSAIVEAATKSGNRAMLSEALLHCYDSLNDNQKMYYLKDLQEAMPEFAEIINLYMQKYEDKAPRPGDGIAGPGGCDLSAVTALLREFTSAVNKCCALLQSDFQQTWTILADFNGTFTALINVDVSFQETWSVLADIQNTLTICCENITREFQETWTILGNLTATATVDLSTVFTTLDDLKGTITACCANVTSQFQQTWTILDDLSFTATVDLSPVFTALNDLKTTITTCCTSITNDFQGTWTILSTLGCGCVSTRITQALVTAGGGMYVIASPGNYVLAEDIVSSGPVVIDIDGSDVQLDLCNRSITGSGSTTTIGVLVETGARNITIRDGYISGMVTNGIQIQDGVSQFSISNIRVNNCDDSGISLVGATNSISNGLIENCQIERCARTVGATGGLSIVNANNIVVNGGQYNRNGAPGVTNIATGIWLNGSDNCVFVNASMIGNNGIVAYGFVCVSSNNNVINSCVANDSAAPTNNAYGFAAASGANNVFVDCVASNNRGLRGYGFAILTSAVRNVIKNCLAENNAGTLAFSVPNNINGAGIFIDGFNGADFNSVLNNTVINNNQSGIFDSSLVFNGTPLVNSGTSQTLVAGNTAVDNGLAGPVFTVVTYRNYTVAYPNPGLVVVPVQTVFETYVTPVPTVSMPAGATMISNLDIRSV